MTLFLKWFSINSGNFQRKPANTIRSGCEAFRIFKTSSDFENATLLNDARDPAGLASEEELRNSASELDTCGSIIVPSLSPANRLRVDGFRGVVREVKSVLLK